MKQDDLNSNTRTLIVCFVIGVFSLIPLRFYEVAQMMPVTSPDQVLGVSSQVVLPEVPVQKQMVLEAPYDDIEAGKTSTCIDRGQIEDMVKEANSAKLSEKDKEALVNTINTLEVCQ